MGNRAPAPAVTGVSARFQALGTFLDSVDRRPRLWLPLVALLLAAQIRPWWFPQGDGRSFLSMARSFALDGQMRNLGRDHLWYFPGYSLLLSPLYLLSDRPLWLLSAFQWSSAILLLFGVYYWARSVVPQWGGAIWVAALTVINEGVWFNCARTMNEIPFMCGFVWSANAVMAFGRQRAPGRTFLFGALAAFLVLLTSLIRPAGILLAVGFGLHLAWRAVRSQISWTRAVALTLVVGIPGSAAIVGFLQSDRRTAAESHARTYLNNFGDSAASPLKSYAEGVRLAIRDSGRIVIPGMFKAYQEEGWRDLNLLIYVPLGAALAVGWWRLVRTTADPLLLMAPFYMLLYIAYPYEAGARFYIPLLPLLMAGLVKLLDVPRMTRVRPFLVATVLSAHLAVTLVYWLAIDSPRGWSAHVRWPEIDQIAQSIDRDRDQVRAWHVSGDDIFMLELALDRRVPIDRPDSIPGNAEWVVTSRDDFILPHCECRAETHSLRLLHRSVYGSSRESRPLAQ